MLLLVDQSLKSLMDHLRINSSTDVGSMIVSEAGQGHVDKLRELFNVHPDKVGYIKIIDQASMVSGCLFNVRLDCNYFSYTQIAEVCNKNKEAGEVSEFNTNKSLLFFQAAIL